jgi:hypothetical protein
MCFQNNFFHHPLFRDRNFTITLTAVIIEGMAFMAAAIYFPYSLSVLQASTMDPYRQALCYNIAFCTFFVAAFASALYIYKIKSVRSPCMMTFFVFLAFFIAMASVTATTPEANFWATSSSTA